MQENLEQGNLKFYMNQLERVGASGSYINRREVTKRFRVPPGHYIIIPSTYDSDKAGKFLLRMFTEKQADQASVFSVDDRPFLKKIHLSLYLSL